jgi:hypothetical protein
MIYSDFLRTLRFGNDWFKLIDSDAYYGAYHQVIDALLSRPHSCVKLAVLSDEPDTCLGWSMSESNMLHFIYVKGDARNKGIGRSILPKEFDTITHLTTIGLSVWNNKFPNAIFNPFL